MATIHLVEGPVGAGKSTYAARLGKEHSAPHLNLDDWMARLFRPDRPDTGTMEWYIERKARCIEQIWKVAASIMEVGSDVVLELGLIQQADRERFYERMESVGYDMVIHVLEAPRDVRRERVHWRNQRKGSTFSMEVPEHFFELASDMWERLDESECNGRQVRFVDTGDADRSAGRSGNPCHRRSRKD